MCATIAASCALCLSPLYDIKCCSGLIGRRIGLVARQTIIQRDVGTTLDFLFIFMGRLMSINVDTLMPGSQSPRKQPSHHTLDAKPSSSKPNRQVPYVKRAFFGAIVVDGVETPRDLTLDVQDLVASFGEAMDMDPEPSTSSSRPTTTRPCFPLRAFVLLSLIVQATHRTDANERPPSHPARYPLSPDEPSPFPANAPTRSSTTMVSPTSSTNSSRPNVPTSAGSSPQERIRRPLRAFSRNRDTFLIPPYEAKVIFGNIDALVPVNEAFLADLERCSSRRPGVGGIGDVALTHFRTDAGSTTMFEREVKKNGGQNPFAAFIERVKYSTWDGRNRIGLRELLMEPVQRIPRYTLLFSQMIKQMPPHDPQRAKLTEARELASDIARADLDEETKRAATMYCLKASIEDFPASLWSNSRKFIDCVDCVDILQTSSSLRRQMTQEQPHQGGESRVIAFVRLDEIDKVAMKVKSLSGGSKKPGMVYKGVVEVTDVVCTDNGGADMHIYLETPPPDQSGMWAGRPFRQLSVVLPPSTINLDPTRTEDAKGRFLESLWTVQARYRTRSGQSVVLSGEEREVGVGGMGGVGGVGGMGGREGVVTIAKPYYNLYPRTWFSREPKKTKLVYTSTAPAPPTPSNSASRAVCGGAHTASRRGSLAVRGQLGFSGGRWEEDIVHTGSVAERVVNIIHQYGLFSFKTGIGSAPVTPSTNRTRAGILGEAIARNLFHSHSRPGSSSASKSSGGADFFGGSLNAHHTPHKRARMTVASRSSANTTSTGTTGDSHSTSSLSRFARSRSTSMSTAATSAMMELDSEHEHDGKSVKSFAGAGGSGSGSSRRSMARKLIKTRRSKSPMPMVITTMAAPGEEVEPVRSASRASRASSEWTDADDDDDDDDEEEGEEEEEGEGEEEGGFDEGETIGAIQRDESDFDLSARLALARKNSQSQTEQLYGSVTPGEETIYEYEDEPPQSLRSSSRASKRLPPIPDEFNASSTSLPIPAEDDERSDSGRLSRPESRTGDRRPRGPRTPSPLPPPVMTRERSGATMEALDTLESTFAELAVSAHGLPTTPLPRSRRQIFDPSTLSRSSSAAGPSSSTHTYSGGSGDAPDVQNHRASLGGEAEELEQRHNEDAEKLFEKSEVVKAKTSDGGWFRSRRRRAMWRDYVLFMSSLSLLTGLQRLSLRDQGSQARMEEMQRVIQRRGGDAATPRRPLSFHQGDSPSRSPFERPRDDGTATAMNEVAKQSFNEELDKVFYEVSLPEGEDWEALAQNLHDTKAEKRELERQNKLLQLRLAEEQLHSDTASAHLELRLLMCDWQYRIFTLEMSMKGCCVYKKTVVQKVGVSV
ncbi:hypothetical protein BC629DRAFT_1440376 [Irpex lacteus]|nr:hypothetical protein BC629DRAFT_1440376 [Irpex lacteus]